jgi:hypothetical protein
MTILASDVEERVEEELARMTDRRLAAALQRHLVPPRPCQLRWDYGPEEAYPGLVVAEFRESRTGIAFSEFGFGPASPWVLVNLDDLGFGMDSESFDRLEGAFRSSMAWDEPPPPGDEVD